jgi:hypothetical protein
MAGLIVMAATDHEIFTKFNEKGEAFTKAEHEKRVDDACMQMETALSHNHFVVKMSQGKPYKTLGHCTTSKFKELVGCNDCLLCIAAWRVLFAACSTYWRKLTLCNSAVEGTAQKPKHAQKQSADHGSAKTACGGGQKSPVSKEKASVFWSVIVGKR